MAGIGLGLTMIKSRFLGRGALFICLLLVGRPLLRQRVISVFFPDFLFGDPFGNPPTPSQESFNTSTKNAPDCNAIISAADVDFTLAIHVSTSRMHLMKSHCARWGNKHPISIAVGTNYSKEEAISQLVEFGCNMSNVKVSFENFTEGVDRYPVNKLRNKALAGVTTTHAVLLDADFIISHSLPDILMNHRPNLTDPMHALVLPAFELNSSSSGGVPRSKGELLQYYGYPGRWRNSGKKKRIREFAFDYRNNPGGHNSTDYKKWLAMRTYDLEPIKCLQSPRYEPYLVFRYCRDLPPFQESFSGYGQNKITWMLHFRRMGYRLSQIGRGFVVHVPHRLSSDKIKWIRKRKQGESVKSDEISRYFQSWLEAYVPDQTAIPYCES
jgi:hypothetical protein